MAERDIKKEWGCELMLYFITGFIFLGKDLFYLFCSLVSLTRMTAEVLFRPVFSIYLINNKVLRVGSSMSPEIYA